jgi:Outer membrane protein beta-barrel domain
MTYVVLPYPDTHIQNKSNKSLCGGEMSLKRLTVAVMVSVCAFAGHAMAQKNELSGLVGRTFISDQTITASTFTDNKLRFGNGLSFEVNYARRVMSAGLFSVALEVPFVFNPDEDLHAHAPTLVPGNYRSYFVTPAARVNLFPDVAVSPWVSVGGGVGHFNESSTLLLGGNNPGKTGTTTGVFQAGVGLDVRLLRKFTLRGEVRDFWSGAPQVNVNTGNSRQHNLFAGAGIVWHF